MFSKLLILAAVHAPITAGPLVGLATSGGMFLEDGGGNLIGIVQQPYSALLQDANGNIITDANGNFVGTTTPPTR